MLTKKGFSLLEILLVMGILAILGTVAFSSFVNYQIVVEADEEANRIRSLLRFAQGKSINFEENSQWGVHFFNPSSGSPLYELFAGSSYPGTIKETAYLPPRFTFTSPAVGTVQDIIFKKRNGESMDSSTITITITPTSGQNQSRNISVTSQGNIQ